MRRSSEPSFRVIQPLEHCLRRKPSELPRRVGGKAAGLAWLVRNELPVPSTWVIDVEPFRALVDTRLPAGHDPHALLRLRASDPLLVERTSRVRLAIETEPLEPDLEQDLELLWNTFGKDAPWGFAVRSSATSEDDALTSMAGLASTVLGVRGAPALARAVREVWASAFTPRALVYLASHGVRDLSMAVVIQIVVRADAAGVAFTGPPPGTEDPLRPSELLVNAGLGLGAPVVDGRTSPDVVRVERATGEVVEYLAVEKSSALEVTASGVREIAVAPERSRAPALTQNHLARLAEYARKLERLRPGVVFDLEFAVERDRVWLVQARPASSGAGYPEGGEADTVWSRANVGEALPGPATPLTWSIARSFSELGFRQAFDSLGCSVPRGATLVASVYGRFYLNLTEFMRIAAQVPGLDPRTLVDLAGGAGTERLEAQVRHVSRRKFYARLPVTGARLLAEQMLLSREIEKFELEGKRAHATLSELDLTILPDDALATTLRETRRLLDRAGSLMLRSASASLISHLALKTVLGRLVPIDAERIAQALSAGVGDLESALPGVALARVAQVARREPPARSIIERGVAATLSDLPDGATRRAFAQFLDEYGDRAVREAELAFPRWREDPSPLFRMLRASLHAPPAHAEDAMQRVRETAERELSRIESQLSIVEMTLLRALVARAHKFARQRERMRAWVTRVLGMLRRVALDTDRRLLRVDRSLERGSAFFCTFEELIALLLTGRPDFSDRIRLRKAEHARDRARPDPPATFVGRPPLVVLAPASGVVLQGLPAGGGIVEGTVRLVRNDDDMAKVAPGDIIVAHTTDTGLTPLFLVAAGVVTELGGPLSHAALVAREYGIPAVVNVLGATTALGDGDRVRLDGNRGRIERLRRAHDDGGEPTAAAPDGRATDTSNATHGAL
jgi:pyruvate,water dikinase